MPNDVFFRGKSAETGFRSPELEKIYRLVLMLSEINRGELNQYLALRGGTAINLCYQQLPRLSIDIDMVLVRDGDREKMLADRGHLQRQLPKLAEAQGYKVDAYLKEYLLDTFQLKYENVFRAPDNIKVEINYIAGRVPIDPFEMRKPHDLFELDPDPVQTLSVNEVYASKVEALIKRHAARDLFDVYQLANTSLVQVSELRPRTLFSCCVELPYDFRSELGTNPANPITQKQISDELRPYLRKKAEFDLAEAKKTVGGYCQELFNLETGHRDFLDNLFDKGVYSPELLFPGKIHLRDHPGIKWRLQQLSKKAS